MEEKARAILAAIKHDDLAAFKRYMDDETERYSFGRFPILSLCYLYGSRKIAAKYEKTLIKLSDYTVVKEDRESYLRFRRKARRVLRLYVGGRTVSPLVMLAVLGKHDALRALYPAAHKDAAIRDEIEYAERILFDSPVVFKDNRIRIRRQKLTLWQKVSLSAASCLSVVMLVCAVLGMLFIPRDRGTADDPVLIANEKQLSFALEKEGYFALTNDVTITDVNKGTSFSGELDGQGKTIRFAGAAAQATAFPTLTGTIKNVNIVIEGQYLHLEESKSLFIELNEGTLENVTVTINVDFSVAPAKTAEVEAKETEEKTIYLSCFCGINKGTIKNCRAICNITAENEGMTDVYLSPLVSQNYGTVSQCRSSGSIQTNTVDLSGMVTENNEGGVILSSESDVYAKQTTESAIWSPNAGGLCITNKGTISECVFTGTIEEKSGGTVVRRTVYDEVNNRETVLVPRLLASGLCILNQGTISGCTFSGTVKGETSYVVEEDVGESPELRAGGISCQNNGQIENCICSGTIEAETQLAQCLVGSFATMNYNLIQGGAYSGKVTARSANGQVVAGGLVALNSYSTEKQNFYTVISSLGQIVGCTTSGNVVASSEGEDPNFVGGVVGYNQTYMQQCTSTAKVSCVGKESYVGGVVGANIYDSGLYGVNTGADSCVFEGEAEIGKESYVGGIAGLNTCYVTNCQSKGKITAAGNGFSGGVVGFNRGSLRGCSVESEMIAGDSCTIGGIAAVNAASISLSSCQAKITVKAGEETLCGGLVGENNYMVSACTADMTCEVGVKSVIGGAVGSSSGTVTECDVVCNVVAGEESVFGGIVGSSSGTVTYSRLTGSVATDGSTVGGVVGKNEKGNVQYCFSALTTTGEDTVYGGVVGLADYDNVNYTLTLRDQILSKEDNQKMLEEMSEEEAEKAIEEVIRKNAKYYKNAYVGTCDGFGEITDIKKEDNPEAYSLQATAYATEADMKKGEEYKEVYGSDETDQKDVSLSYRYGVDGAI